MTTGVGRRPFNSRLTERDFERICMELLAAENEAEVDGIIAANPAMANPANWLPLDGRDTNWNVTNNQSASGAKAATELLTNGVDAILMRHCVAQGIDPRSPDAPRSAHEAIERFLGWKGGRMMEHMRTQRERTQWAQANFVVAFSGKNDPGQPSLTFCDTGEGQHPEDFERTFLSLSAGNKKEIAFVQGKFNMGSSGVIGYCGTRKYKLIVSRKHTMDGKWGWTLCRQRPTGDLPVIEYFKSGGANGQIPAFSADVLHPLFTRDGKPFEDVALEFGTAVKLYDFQIGSDFNDFNSTRRVFIEHLADTLLPVRVLDMRVKPSKGKGRQRALGVDGRTFLGLEHHLSTGVTQEDSDDDNNIGRGARRIDVGSYTCPELGTISVRAYYTEDSITNRSSSGGVIRSNNRVFHTVNGQIQHRESRGFLTECKLPALKDHLVIVVDASNLTRKAHFEVWKADRETLKLNKVSERYLAIVRKLVMDSAELKDLNEETFRRQLEKATSSTNEHVFRSLVEKDPTLANLLRGTAPQVGSIFGGDSRRERVKCEAFVGTVSPTFFRLSVPASGIEIPRGGTAFLKASTSVGDDYMIRDVHPGRIVLSQNLVEAGVTIARSSLRSGRMLLALSAPEDAPLGEMEVSIGLTDGYLNGKVVGAEFRVRIVEAKPEEEKKEKHPKRERSAHLAMPTVILLTRDGRQVHGMNTVAWDGDWNEYDGGTTEVGEGSAVIVKLNYDNIYLQDYLMRAKESERESIWTKYSIAMQVSALGLERRIAQIRESGQSISEDDIDRLRRNMAAGLASVAATIVDRMPRVMHANLGAMAEED